MSKKKTQTPAFGSRRTFTEGDDHDSRTLYVRIAKPINAITDKNFRLHFIDFEEDIQRSKVIFDHETDLPKGFGFVTFKSREAASEAIEYFQDTMLCGRHKLALSFKRRKNETGSHGHPGVMPTPPRANPGANPPRPAPRNLSNQGRNDAVIEFKDEVLGLMIMDEGSLVEVAMREGVELRPLPVPRQGFQLKGEQKGVKVVQNYCDQLRTTMEQRDNILGYSQIVLSDSCQPLYAATRECRESLKRQLKVVATASFEGSSMYQVGVRLASDHVTLVRIVVGKLQTELTDAIVVLTGKPAVDSKHLHSYPIDLPNSMWPWGETLKNTKELLEIGQTESLDGGVLPCSHVIQALFPLSAQRSASSDSCDVLALNSLSLATEMNLGSITFPGITTHLVNSVFDGLRSLCDTSLHTVNLVLGTESEARRYADALRSHVSSGVGLDTSVATRRRCAETVSSSEALPVGHLGLMWSWRGDDGSYTPYNQVATDALNLSFQHNRNGSCQLAINGVRYVVSFSKMSQVNRSTNHQRDVIKSLPRDLIARSSSSPGTLQSQHVSWKYRDDFDRFMSYSPANIAKIEDMFQKQAVPGGIVIHGRSYRMDFKRMKQINVSSKYERDIKRVANNTCNSPDSQIAKCHPKKSFFLSDNEVVINMKGPLENLPVAKKRLEEMIKSLLFSKRVNLPATATASLHQHLQAIAKKHHISCTADGTKASNISLMLEGLESKVKEALPEMQELIIQFQDSSGQLARSSVQGSRYPQEWDPMSESDTVKILPLAACQEYRTVSQKFQETMPNVYVVKVQRVQNKVLWSRYMQSWERLHEKNAGNVNQRDLFHGTRDLPPENICRSEEGFDMRHSRQGLWGQANYFAVKAKYSDTYSHRNMASNAREMILAKVLTGDSYFSERDSSLRMPPEKQHEQPAGENQLQQVLYDSVNGETGGSAVYMTYSNDRAYPAYIITYSTTRPVGFSQATNATSPSPGLPLYSTATASPSYAQHPQAAHTPVLNVPPSAASLYQSLPPSQAPPPPVSAVLVPQPPVPAPPPVSAPPPPVRLPTAALAPPTLSRQVKRAAAAAVAKVKQKGDDKCIIS